jgi:hypothetical protein
VENLKSIDEFLEKVPRLKKEGVPLDVDPRTPAATGEEGIEESGLGEGTRSMSA